MSIFIQNLKEFKFDDVDKKNYSDYVKYLLTKQNDFKNIEKGLILTEGFIKQKDLVLVGGMTIDFLLKMKNKQIYNEDVIPDYDFVTNQNVHNAFELAHILCMNNLPKISAIVATHKSTMRVRVDQNVVADITYVPENIFTIIKRSSISYNGFNIFHPLFQYLDQYRALSFPFENFPRPVFLNRWQKDIKRHKLLFENFPPTIYNMERFVTNQSFNFFKEEIEKKELPNIIKLPISLLSRNFILNGWAAYSYYLTEISKLIDLEKLKENLGEKLKNFKNIDFFIDHFLNFSSTKEFLFLPFYENLFLATDENNFSNISENDKTLKYKKLLDKIPERKIINIEIFIDQRKNDNLFFSKFLLDFENLKSKSIKVELWKLEEQICIIEKDDFSVVTIEYVKLFLLWKHIFQNHTIVPYLILVYSIDFLKSNKSNENFDQIKEFEPNISAIFPKKIIPHSLKNYRNNFNKKLKEKKSPTNIYLENSNNCELEIPDIDYKNFDDFDLSGELF